MRRPKPKRQRYQAMSRPANSIAVSIIVVVLIVLAYYLGLWHGQNKADNYRDLIIRQHESQRNIDQGRFEVICERAPEACKNVE